MKKTPTGFVATCQCGNIVGAVDYTQADKTGTEKLLSKWLSDGCTIEPKFEGFWAALVVPCTCDSVLEEV